MTPDPFATAMMRNRRPQALMMTPTDWNPNAIPARVGVEIKHDGIHTGFRADLRHAFTREGCDFVGADHTRRQLLAIDEALREATGNRHVLFGEYVHADGFGAAVGDFRRGTGTGSIMLFDAVPVDAYEGCVTSERLAVRKSRLGHAFRRAGSWIGDVGLVSTGWFSGDARDNIEVLAGVMWNDGHEGIVVKDADSPYVRGESSHWQRIKRKNTVDVPIVSVDAPGGRLKAIVVNHAGVEVRVGVGFSIADRAAPAAFSPGRIVEISHLGVTPHGSLRSPSFLRTRPDKEC